MIYLYCNLNFCRESCLSKMRFSEIMEKQKTLDKAPHRSLSEVIIATEGIQCETIEPHSVFKTFKGIKGIKRCTSKLFCLRNPDISNLFNAQIRY